MLWGCGQLCVGPSCWGCFVTPPRPVEAQRGGGGGLCCPQSPIRVCGGGVPGGLHPWAGGAVLCPHSAECPHCVRSPSQSYGLWVPPPIPDSIRWVRGAPFGRGQHSGGGGRGVRPCDPSDGGVLPTPKPVLLPQTGAAPHCGGWGRRGGANRPPRGLRGKVKSATRLSQSELGMV